MKRLLGLFVAAAAAVVLPGGARADDDWEDWREERREYYKDLEEDRREYFKDLAEERREALEDRREEYKDWLEDERKRQEKYWKERRKAEERYRERGELDLRRDGHWREGDWRGTAGPLPYGYRRPAIGPGFEGPRYRAFPEGYGLRYDAGDLYLPEPPPLSRDTYYAPTYDLWPSKGQRIGGSIGARIGAAIGGPEGARIGAAIGSDIGAEVDD